jgi:hypothetical protein
VTSATLKATEEAVDEIAKATQELVDREKDLEVHRQRCEERAAEFVAVTTAALVAWVPKAARDAAGEAAEHSKQLGAEGLAKVKAGISEFVANDLPAEVAKQFDAPKLWAHRNGFVDPNGNTSDSWHYAFTSSKDHITRPINRSLSAFGKLWASFGFKLPRAMGGNTAVYPGYFQWSEAMKKGIEAYAAALKDFVTVQNDCEKKRRQKEGLEAKKLWDDN